MGSLILIVEDEVLVRMDLELTLEDAGFEVISAATAHAAIDKLNAYHAELAGLVTDIRLEKGASGWEVAEHSRELVSALPVVYMSGDSASEWARRGVKGSVMLGKPFSSREILEALRTSASAIGFSFSVPPASATSAGAKQAAAGNANV